MVAPCARRSSTHRRAWRIRSRRRMAVPILVALAVHAALARPPPRLRRRRHFRCGAFCRSNAADERELAAEPAGDRHEYYARYAEPDGNGIRIVRPPLP